ncbi:non-ribosomal peptide synthetase [Xenorhabdus szentirmaii]|uniref:Non-ribosomal peptide synthetase (Modular protein) n=2 Tax=Xenorhabdus szentirmaii TaxID=290112 RepID=W1IS87_9GAMM|nr:MULTISPECIES: non-ribosomal peptide synthetase [Xenorhabdus]MBD2781859.1 amino acid adenylation domain-containing protein [Xenorhabdus sp. 38]MBD2793116.1 amino acid adenylation domain-containing protein [Xenorhabdus sp. CUL]MBD2801484.1 amino acid adenylation domain-containing protein [Xenorhabdus sp. M]MBD2820027.1 amino acid adenylation domain-containing protein [Xenorhabdus sp. 42]MBD2826145.1 amino acid adenylation domain-containing protein [Xenorhabdus sp. 5]
MLPNFLEQVSRYPDKIAISTPENSLDYQTLKQQAASVAGSLRQLGVTHEEPVAILLSPGIEQITSQLAILMAGGSCVPLDPNVPPARLNDMLGDLDVKWTITDSPDNSLQLHTTCVAFSELCKGKRLDDSEMTALSPNHRSHVLFTSGTTGKPKGVQIELKSIMRTIIDTEYVRFTPEDRIACTCNPTFDISLFEIWGALLNGAMVFVPSKSDVLDIEYFQAELERKEISIISITATLFNLIAKTYPQAFRNIRYLLLVGEAPNAHMVKQVLETDMPPKHLLNAYGPTESTIFALSHDITLDDLADGSVPIGVPINYTSAFVLNDNLEPLEPGNMGQLYLGGEGLSRGYWNRDELNADRFVNVAIPGHSEPMRLYKTGDLSWQRDDGVFMFSGRIDSQVKIRGHRIELEEIEIHILENKQVRLTKVCAVKNEGEDDFLAAFVVPQSPDTFDREQLIQQLSGYLPAYMLPRIFVVEDIPMTPHGKADQRKLMELLTTRESCDERPAGFTDTEYAIYRIWGKILHNCDISLDDNFFQLGGSSLQASRLVIELAREFNQHFLAQTIYEVPTLRQLAKIVSQGNFLHSQDDETEEWLCDGQLPDDIRPLPEAPQDWASLTDASIFLTGATGFLGSFLLRDLLSIENIQKNIKQVICLVRAKDDGAGLKRIKSALTKYGLWSPIFAERIRAVAGDLSLPKLGLSDELYDELTNASDVVFHSAADVNYIHPYRTQRASNIDSTLNVLRFATQGKAKSMHHISTIAAFGPVGLLHSTTHIYENDCLIPYMEGLKYDVGYAQSKWVVERLVWQARELGIPLSVYRPGFIMGDSVTGIGNQNDFVARLIVGCIAIGACPELPCQWKEFVSVDYVSSALLAIASDIKNLGQSYHLVPPDRETQSPDVNEFFRLLEECCGHPLQSLPYSEWLSRLLADPHLDNNALLSLLPMLSERVYKQLTRWEVNENMPIFDTTNTVSALSNATYPVHFTPMGKELLSKYLNYYLPNGI